MMSTCSPVSSTICWATASMRACAWGVSSEMPPTRTRMAEIKSSRTGEHLVSSTRKYGVSSRGIHCIHPSVIRRRAASSVMSISGGEARYPASLRVGRSVAGGSTGRPSSSYLRVTSGGR